MSSDRLLAGKIILVVENEWLIADDFCRVLANEGAHVIGPVPSAGQALVLIDGTPIIDAAVLDIHLGSGLDVYPVAAVLRRRGVPFIFATGYDKHAIRRDFAGTPHLRKPFSPGTIGSALAALSSTTPPVL